MDHLSQTEPLNLTSKCSLGYQYLLDGTLTESKWDDDIVKLIHQITAISHPIYPKLVILYLWPGRTTIKPTTDMRCPRSRLKEEVHRQNASKR